MPLGVSHSDAAFALVRELRDAGEEPVVLHRSSVLGKYLSSCRPGWAQRVHIRSYYSLVRELWSYVLGSDPEFVDDWNVDLDWFLGRLVRLARPRVPQLAHLVIVDGQSLPRMFYRALRLLGVRTSVLVDPAAVVGENGSAEAEICRELGVESATAVTQPIVCGAGVLRLATGLLDGADNPEDPPAERGGEPPGLFSAVDLEEEAELPMMLAKRFPGDRIGILLPRTEQVLQFQTALRDLGVERVRWYAHGHGVPDHEKLDFETPGIVVLTWVSARYLDFDHVVLPQLQDPVASPHHFAASLASLLAKARKTACLSYTGVGEPTSIESLPVGLCRDFRGRSWDLPAPDGPGPGTSTEDDLEGPWEPGGWPADVDEVPAAEVAAAVVAARRRLTRDVRLRRAKRDVLTAAEEVGLAQLMRGEAAPLGTSLEHGFRARVGDGDERAVAFDVMVLHNQGLVHSQLPQFRGRGLEDEDLVHHGVRGLMRAVEKFDASRGFKFSTYATWWIRQSISRAVADEGRAIRLPVHVHDEVMRVERARKSLSEKGVRPSPAQLSQEADLPPERVVECLRLAVGVVSLDMPVSDDGDTTLGEVVAVRNALNDPDLVLDRSLTRQLVHQAMAKLPERQARVLELRFGLDGEGDHTLEEIGAVFGVSRERIRQIEKQAKASLLVVLREIGLLGDDEPLPPPANQARPARPRARQLARPAVPAGGFRAARTGNLDSGNLPRNGLRTAPIHHVLADYVSRRRYAGARNFVISTTGPSVSATLVVADDGPPGADDALQRELRASVDAEHGEALAHGPDQGGNHGVGAVVGSCDEVVVWNLQDSARARRCLVFSEAPNTGQWWLDSATAELPEKARMPDVGTSVAIMLRGLRLRALGATLETELSSFVEHVGLLQEENLRLGQLRVFVFGVPVQPRDAFLARHPASQDLGSEYLVADGLHAEVNPRVLPHPDKLAPEDEKSGGSPSRWEEEQGFYVRCAGEYLSAGGWLGLPGLVSEEATSLARILVEIEEEDRHAWQSANTGGAVVAPEPFRDRLYALANIARKRSERVFAHRRESAVGGRVLIDPTVRGTGASDGAHPPVAARDRGHAARGSARHQTRPEEGVLD